MTTQTLRNLVSLLVILWVLICVPTQVLEAQTSVSVTAIAWSPNGAFLAIGKSDGTLQTIDAQTKAQLNNFNGHTGKIRSIAWSPDGSKLASTGEDATVRVWNSATGSLLGVYSEFSHGGIAVRWSPDGTKIASLTLQIRLTIHEFMMLQQTR